MRTSEITVVGSLLDRLIDNQPELSHEPPGEARQSVSELKKSLARDLEALLNTRQEALHEIPTEYIEVNKSLLMYGLPDFTMYNPRNQHDRSRMRRDVEQAISLFEPRLTRVRVTLETPRDHEPILRFRVEALLQVEPARDAVIFDTVLQLSTREYVVEEKD